MLVPGAAGRFLSFTVHNSNRAGIWPAGAQVGSNGLGKQQTDEPSLHITQQHLAKSSQRNMQFTSGHSPQLPLLQPIKAAWEELLLRVAALHLQLHSFCAALVQACMSRCEQLKQQVLKVAGSANAAAVQPLESGRQQLVEQLKTLQAQMSGSAPSAPASNSSKRARQAADAAQAAGSASTATAYFANISSSNSNSRSQGGPQQYIAATWQSVQQHPLYSRAAGTPGLPYILLGLAAAALRGALRRRRQLEQQMYLDELQLAQPAGQGYQSQRARWARAIGTEPSGGGSAGSSMQEEVSDQEAMAAAVASTTSAPVQRGWLSRLFQREDDEARRWQQFMQMSGAGDVREVWMPEMADSMAPMVRGVRAACAPAAVWFGAVWFDVALRAPRCTSGTEQLLTAPRCFMRACPMAAATAVHPHPCQPYSPSCHVRATIQGLPVPSANLPHRLPHDLPPCTCNPRKSHPCTCNPRNSHPPPAPHPAGHQGAGHGADPQGARGAQ